MFGHNEIVGQKYFANAEDKLFVTSRFLTLQGEGPFSGKLAYFLRLAKCNLACSFCDTYFDGGTWMDNQEIINDVFSLYNKQYGPFTDTMKMMKKSVFVLTGGEPMLQKNIVPMLALMNEIFAFSQIESNGTVYQDIPELTTLVCSPKCSERDGKPVRYLKPNPKVLDRADCLKFVMNNDPESPYSSIPDWALEWNDKWDRAIYISPMNIYNQEPQKSKDLRAARQNDIDIETRSMVDEVISFWDPGLLNMEANQKNHEYAARYCMKYGLRFQLQTHLFASLA